MQGRYRGDLGEIISYLGEEELGRHVVGRARRHLAGLAWGCRARGSGRARAKGRARAAIKVAVSGRGHLSRTHKPKVAQLAPAIVVEQHVMALQVAVHDGRRLRVQMGHRARHLVRARVRVEVGVGVRVRVSCACRRAIAPATCSAKPTASPSPSPDPNPDRTPSHLQRQADGLAPLKLLAVHV